MASRASRKGLPGGLRRHPVLSTFHGNLRSDLIATIAVMQAAGGSLRLNPRWSDLVVAPTVAFLLLRSAEQGVMLESTATLRLEATSG